MTSTYNDIRAAIEGRIATEMALSPVYPVSYQNIPFTPPNNSPWLQVFLRLGDNAYATLKSFNRQNGVLVVNVFTQQSQGAALNFTIAERIKDLFDRANCLASSLMQHLAHRKLYHQRRSRITRRNLRLRLKPM
jgi:hypothetical protein